MGIDGLWKFVEKRLESQQAIAPAGQILCPNITLVELAYETAFLAKKLNSFRGLRLAVDASMLIVPICKAARQREEKSWDSIADKNWILQKLFEIMLDLASIPFLISIWVFDGPGRPSLKRGKTIRRGDGQWNPEIQAMLTSLGITFECAEGEAEFHAGRLVDWGKADAVLTGDSDIFLATSGKIIRLPEPLNAFLLSNHTLSSHNFSTFDRPSLNISRDDFICIALIVGGDYDLGLFEPHISGYAPSTLKQRSKVEVAFLLSQSIFPSTKKTFSTVLRETLTRHSTSIINLKVWGKETIDLVEVLSKETKLKMKPRTLKWPSEAVVKLYYIPAMEISFSTPLSLPYQPINITSLIRAVRDLGYTEEQIVNLFQKSKQGVLDVILWSQIRQKIMQKEKVGFKNSVLTQFALDVMNIERLGDDRKVTLDIKVMAVEVEKRTLNRNGRVCRTRDLIMSSEVRRLSRLKVGSN